MEYVEFWNWFSDRAAEFSKSLNTSNIVDQIYNKLNRLDERFSVEVSDPDTSGIREMILSANGFRDLFPFVEEFVTNAPELNSWKFVALKPPRGFDFTFRLAGRVLSPAEWSFLPLRDEDKQLGLCIFIPGEQIIIDDAVLQTIIETGVGEKTFSEVHHLEHTHSPESFGQNSWLKMNMLSEYLHWQTNRNNTT